MDNGRWQLMMEPAYTISSPGAFGPGELKKSCSQGKHFYSLLLYLQCDTNGLMDSMDSFVIVHPFQQYFCHIWTMGVW